MYNGICFHMCHSSFSIWFVMQGGCIAEGALECSLHKETSFCFKQLSVFVIFWRLAPGTLKVGSWKFQQRNSDLQHSRGMQHSSTHRGAGLTQSAFDATRLTRKPLWRFSKLTFFTADISTCQSRKKHRWKYRHEWWLWSI